MKKPYYSENMKLVSISMPSEMLAQLKTIHPNRSEAIRILVVEALNARKKK